VVDYVECTSQEDQMYRSKNLKNMAAEVLDADFGAEVLQLRCYEFR